MCGVGARRIPETFKKRIGEQRAEANVTICLQWLIETGVCGYNFGTTEQGSKMPDLRSIIEGNESRTNETEK